MRFPRGIGAAFAAAGLALAVLASAAVAAAAARRFVPRTFPPVGGVHIAGEAVGYGPHRDGQRPDQSTPTRAQVREDLALIARHWRTVRIYGSVGTGDTVLAAIRESGLPVRVVLGVWLAAEDRRDSSGRVVARIPEARAATSRAAGTRLPDQNTCVSLPTAMAATASG